MILIKLVANCFIYFSRPFLLTFGVWPVLILNLGNTHVAWLITDVRVRF